VALTLRAVGGLATREIADAFYVPEATMAQRISRAKHTLRGRRLDQPGDLAVVLDRQDRRRWDTREIAEGVRVLQSALAEHRDDRPPGRYQIEAAIAALHDDAASAAETDWPQILAWYDLVASPTTPCTRTPPPCSGARSRSATCSVPPPGCARPTDCGR
jgi:predicted RNA polymerase sigma factor